MEIPQRVNPLSLKCESQYTIKYNLFECDCLFASFFLHPETATITFLSIFLGETSCIKTKLYLFRKFSQFHISKILLFLQENITVMLKAATLVCFPIGIIFERSEIFPFRNSYFFVRHIL